MKSINETISSKILEAFSDRYQGAIETKGNSFKINLALDESFLINGNFITMMGFLNIEGENYGPGHRNSNDGTIDLKTQVNSILIDDLIFYDSFGEAVNLYPNEPKIISEIAGKIKYEIEK